jgi:hypothetical protein
MGGLVAIHAILKNHSFFKGVVLVSVLSNFVYLLFVLSIKGFAKIARIGTATIPDRQKNCQNRIMMILELYWW